MAKLVKLVFSSDQPGEIIAAVTAARRVLETNGLDCHWIADRITAPVAHADVNHRDDRSKAWFAWHRRHRLAAREREFIENIVRWSAPLTPKQRQWLRIIVDKLEAA